MFFKLKKAQWILIVTINILMLPLFPQERFRETPPSPNPLPELKFPNIVTATLTNGLTLSVIQKENLPIMNLRLIIFSGESSSPEDFPGLATLTTQMLSKGALNLSSAQFVEAIEFIGGEFSSETFSDYSVLNLSFLEEYLDEALSALSQIILQPSFNRREVENVKRTMYYDLRGKTTDPDFMAKRLLFQVLFRNHAYKKMLYTDDVIKNLNRNVLINYFNNHFRPENARLFLIGNLNIQTASRKVSHYLNTWKKGSFEHKNVSSPLSNDKLKICFIDVPKAESATIYLGNIISPPSSEDCFPFLVFNQVLGGTPNSRLFMNLRESKGYAYYAFSDIECFQASCVFYLGIKVRSEVTYATIEESLGEIEKIVKEKIQNNEIEQAKSYLIGNFPLKIETVNNLSLNLSKMQAFNLDDRHWNKYYENIMLIDRDKVFETVQESSLLTPVIVIAGDKNEIMDHLQEFDEVEVYDDKGLLRQTIKKEEEEE